MPSNIPMYVFTGFLESGKTKFIQETLEDERFNAGEKTLLLVFEEGEEEYDISTYPSQNVYIETPSYEELSEEFLENLRKKHHAERVIVELNGMHQAADFYLKTPDTWQIAQEVMFADANTFLSYNQNMRQLTVDKLAGAELVVFNRMAPGTDVMPFHKIARAVNRRIDILYEFTDGTTKQDDIEDPLPFDINAPVVKIEDGDYALWYRDLSEDPKKYDGKVVEYKGLAAVNPRMKPGMFFFGRQLMTCCVEDIQFAGLLTLCDADKMPENGKWYTMRLSVAYKWHKLYGRKGPVLTLQNIEPAEAPAQPVATFY